MANVLLEWDKTGERLFETGVSNVALFVSNDDGSYGDGVAWSGMSSIQENPEGGEPSDVYADNIKYLTIIGVENLKGTIEAYYYPDAFEVCNGAQTVVGGMVVGQQSRKGFGIAYMTKLGNDAAGVDFGEKLHFVYGCKVSPSDKEHSTINENPEAGTMSWSFSAQTVGSADMPTVEGKTFKQCASVEISSKYWDEASQSYKATDNFDKLLEYVYGKKGASSSEDVKAKFPTPKQIYAILTNGSI